MLMEVAAVAFAAAVAQGETYSSMEVDVSTLPRERAFLRGLLLSRAWDRTPPSDAAGRLTVRFENDASIPGENAAVVVADGTATVRASRFRAFVFGAGALLRSVRWGDRTFELDDGTIRFEPKKKLRQAYFACHFNNWYHRASPDEMLRYIEDLALWGINSFHLQIDYPRVDAAAAEPGEIDMFVARSKAIAARVHALDAGLTTSGGGNVAPLNMPAGFLAEPVNRGANQFNVCPARPGALEYLLDLRRKSLARTKDIPVDGFGYWPYDEGGCACTNCAPWGGNGYVRLIEKLKDLNEAARPGADHIVSTWFFDDADWKGFYRYLEKQDWIDYLLVDSQGEFPRYPLEHPVPKNIPIISFPEISMWGRFPWGGTGANPLPARFERLFRQAENVVQGFRLYSEGIYEDYNKVFINALYVDPSTKAHDFAAAYAAWELPGCDVRDFAEFVDLLEATYHTKSCAKRGWRGCVVANYVKDAPAEEIAERLALARKASALADRIDAAILPNMRRCWRWRLLYLRAKIDEAVFEARTIRPASVLPLYAELNALYHAERQKTSLLDGTWRGYTCAPYAENDGARKYSGVSTRPWAKTDLDGRHEAICVSYGGIDGIGHVQGICVSPRAIYLARTEDIVKADWNGKIVKRVKAPNHTGDLCWWKGRVYASVADRKARAGKGRIMVYDEDLNLLRDVPTDKTMDGIACLDGVLYIGNGIKPKKGMKGPHIPHRENLLVRYDAETLELLGDKKTIDYGQDTCYGTQNITTDGNRIFARFYTPRSSDDVVVFTRDMKPLAAVPFGGHYKSHGIEHLEGDLFLMCHTRNYGKEFRTETPVVAELTFWRWTGTAFVDATRRSAAPRAPVAGTRQHDAVAAAYALRTPERTNRFADGWAFARAVYGLDMKAGAPTNLVVFAYDGAAGGDVAAAVREAVALLEPGDIIASDGTNACLYAGDVYGDGRGKLLAVNDASGVVGEWDIGLYLLNWPHDGKKLVASKRFEIVRPLLDASVKVAGKRRFPKGECEKVADERMQGVLGAAWAHYLKNECAQYDSERMIDGTLQKKIGGNWSRKHDRIPIETCTRDFTFYSVCSSYDYEVYYWTLGYPIGEDAGGRLSDQLVLKPAQDILVYRHEKGKDGKTDAQVIEEVRSILQPGDVISYAFYPPLRKKNSGHVVIYIGKVDGIPTILHSTGKKYDFENGFDRTEHEGTIVKNDIDDMLFTPGPRYMLRFSGFVILRPLKHAGLALTATGRARAAHPRFRYDRRVAGGCFGSVVKHELLRYSVEMLNADDASCDATVKEPVPEGTQFFSCSEGGRLEGGTIVWPVTLGPRERRTVEWSVRVMAEPGTNIVAASGSAGGIPSNRLVTQVVGRRVSVADAFRWADRNLADVAHLPACQVSGWCGGYRTRTPSREGRVRETRSRDLMPGDVVAVWKDGKPRPETIWVRGANGLVRRTAKGFADVPEEEVAGLLSRDRFIAFRPAADVQ